MALRLKIFHIAYQLPLLVDTVPEKEINEFLATNNLTLTSIETFYAVTKFRSVDDAFNPIGVHHIIYLLYKS